MATPTAAYGLASLGIKMRHHQHKGLYIALKLGGAAVATAAAYKAYVVLKEKSKQQEMLAEASLHHGESDRLHRLDQRGLGA